MGGYLSYEEVPREIPPVHTALTHLDTMCQIPTQWGTSQKLVRIWKSTTKLSNPVDLCFFNDDQIAVADPELEAVVLLSTQTGYKTGEIKGTSIYDITPIAVACAYTGHLLVVDSQKYNLRGHRPEAPHKWTFEWPHIAKEPIQICPTPSGDYIVIDNDEKELSIHGRKGEQLRYFGKRHLDTPAYVAADKFGRIYVVDDDKVSITVLTDRGILMHRFGSKGSRDGELHVPKGICCDPQCNILIADHLNDRISVYNADGSLRFNFTSDHEIKRPTAIALDSERGLLAVICKYLSWIDVSLYKIC